MSETLGRRYVRRMAERVITGKTLAVVRFPPVGVLAKDVESGDGYDEPAVR